MSGELVSLRTLLRDWPLVACSWPSSWPPQCGVLTACSAPGPHPRLVRQCLGNSFLYGRRCETGPWWRAPGRHHGPSVLRAKGMPCTRPSWTCSPTLPGRAFVLYGYVWGCRHPFGRGCETCWPGLRWHRGHSVLRAIGMFCTRTPRTTSPCTSLALETPLGDVPRPELDDRGAGELASLRTLLRDWLLDGVLFGGIMDTSVLRARGHVLHLGLTRAVKFRGRT
jgi:hypothetical protein